MTFISLESGITVVMLTISIIGLLFLVGSAMGIPFFANNALFNHRLTTVQGLTIAAGVGVITLFIQILFNLISGHQITWTDLLIDSVKSMGTWIVILLIIAPISRRSKAKRERP